MPLNKEERQFLSAIDRLKIYLLMLAVTVLLYLLFAPSSELHTTTSIIGISLCGTFWLTHRLLNFISRLDLELTRLTSALKHALTEDQRKQLFP